MGGKNIHKHTRWNMEDGGRGGFGGVGWGASDVHVVCICIRKRLGGGLNTLHVQCIIAHTKIKPGLPD